MTTYTTIGKPITRLEGTHKVTGQSAYAADIQLPDMLHCKVLRSPHAHARIKRIDASKALALDGVERVITAADLPTPDARRMAQPRQHPARDRRGRRSTASRSRPCSQTIHRPPKKRST